MPSGEVADAAMPVNKRQVPPDICVTNNLCTVPLDDIPAKHVVVVPVVLALAVGALNVREPARKPAILVLELAPILVQPLTASVLDDVSPPDETNVLAAVMPRVTASVLDAVTPSVIVSAFIARRSRLTFLLAILTSYALSNMAIYETTLGAVAASLLSVALKNVNVHVPSTSAVDGAMLTKMIQVPPDTCCTINLYAEPSVAIPGMSPVTVSAVLAENFDFLSQCFFAGYYHTAVTEAAEILCWVKREAP